MSDTFKEQLVKRIQTPKDTAIKVCLVIIVILLGLTALLHLYQFGIIVFILLGLGAKYLSSYLNIEYEYVFTNGELDIDIIYDQSRRKRIFSQDVKTFEIMAHINDKNHEHTFNSAQEILDYSSGILGNNTYAFITIINGKKTKVIIEPNDKMLKAFNKVMSHRSLHIKAGTVLI